MYREDRFNGDRASVGDDVEVMEMVVEMAAQQYACA